MDNLENQHSPDKSRGSEKCLVSHSSGATTTAKEGDQDRLKSNASDGSFPCANDDDDDVISGLDCSFTTTTTQGPVIPCSKYTVFSTEEIKREMNEQIENTSGLLQLTTTIARALLNYFGWNKERLFNVYFGDEDVKKTLQNAGIDIASSQETLSESLSLNGRKVECSICVSETETNDMVGMNCGHIFCKDCWRTFLTSQIMDQGKGAQITCIAHNCCTLVDDDTVKILISDDHVLKKYEQQVLSSFIQKNQSYKWCPGPGCIKSIRIETICDMNPEVKCDCGETFCFQCTCDAHAPLSCELIKKWMLKCKEFQELNTQWILANTKPCPNCKANIEKDGGCNYILCGNGNCGFEFCWICLGAWEDHDPYICNRYEQPNSNAVSEAPANVLKRFKFYFKRYMSQQASLKLEKGLFDRIKEHLKDLVSSSGDLQFIKCATDTLCECRKTLQHTFVFAYFVSSCNQMEIFVKNQNDFQRAVEKLSCNLGKKTDWKSLLKSKTNVVNLTWYCQSRRNILLQHVFEGYLDSETEKCWLFNEQV